MLHYDYFYTIGKTHLVCEDYATQGDIPTPFIVLCDGCSGSNNTDVGARILALTTKHLIENSTEWPLDYIEFGQRLIKRASEIVEEIQVNQSVLDATVVLAFLHNEEIHVYIYGDGCLLFKDHAGNIGTIEVSFLHNAPFYLTYWCSEERQREYARYDEKPLIINDSVNGKSEPMPFQTPLVFVFPLEKFPIVAITSDGAVNCVDSAQRILIPLQEIAKHLLKYKNFEGDFVKRRTKRALEQLAEQGIYAADDLSIGTFALTELIMES